MRDCHSIASARIRRRAVRRPRMARVNDGLSRFRTRRMTDFTDAIFTELARDEISNVRYQATVLFGQTA